MAKRDRNIRRHDKGFEISESIDDRLLPSAEEIAKYKEADPELPAFIRETAKKEQEFRHRYHNYGAYEEFQTFASQKISETPEITERFKLFDWFEKIMKKEKFYEELSPREGQRNYEKSVVEAKEEKIRADDDWYNFKFLPVRKSIRIKARIRSIEKFEPKFYDE